jgi:large subunit ribosomal protein L28
MKCELCAKNRMSGNKISHSNIKTRKVQTANVQRLRVTVGGTNRRMYACTRCIRSGKVTKVA